MTFHKKIVACAGLVLILSATQIDATRTYYIRGHLIPYTTTYACPGSCRDFLATVGAIGLIAGSCYALKACYDYFVWPEERIEQWERDRIVEIQERNNFVNSLTELDSHSAALIERLSDFGLNAKNSSLDHVLKAAAPLHSAVDSLCTDFKALCTIIEGCGRRHCINDRLIDDALAEARLLEDIIAAVCQTKEYKKEAVEIEKITNGRLSIKLQEAAVMQNMRDMRELEETVIIVEEK